MRIPPIYLFDEVDENTTYIGKAAPGSSEDAPVWRIARYYKEGTISSIKYAGGTSASNSRWSDRTSLSYS